MANPNDAYHRLRELPPLEQAPGTSAPTEAKRLKAWIAAMPRANLRVVQVQLRDALICLERQRMEGADRLAALELLRAPMLEVTGLIENALTGSQLPLGNERERQVQDAEFFHLWLAHGYRRAAAELCAPAGKLPFLRGGSVVLAVGRAMAHYAQALRLAWRTHRRPAPGCWQGLHRCYGFALAQNLAEKRIEDPAHLAEGTLAGFYRVPVLVALGNPYSQSLQGQDVLWRMAQHHAAACGLAAGNGQGSEFPAVPRDEDQGPGAPEERGEDAWRIDPRPLLADVEHTLEAQPGEEVTVSLGRAKSLRTPREILERVRRAFAFATGRGHERLPGGQRLESVIGMSGLHYHVAGGVDLDAFLRQARDQTIEVTERAAWTHRAGEDVRAPLVPVEVLDQGVGGYQLRWDSAAQARARVGEIVGLSPVADDDLPRDWMLGLVRWLKNDEQGGVCAGVQLLARRVRAVALETEGGSAARRALALEVGDGRDGIQLLCPDMKEAATSPMHLVMGEEDGLFDELSGLDAASLHRLFGGRRRMGVAAGLGEYMLLHGGAEEASE